ncbi:hypothetical protein DPMN_110406 [Dreissena polymorpha]|uniref:Uncharacterized protein n=1 Tax=Dreissena polymorpha TaxID=45954 RepID=A0A9D4QN07_DREPO|nr:hypothetical protein DPMN_110406 [Dreissena polymorpha]
METVMNGEQDTRHVTLKEPASFRWLSLQNAVRAIMAVYPAQVTTLESQAASGIAEAKGILQKVRQLSFLLRTAFLLDVFEVVNTLCRAFQKDELDIEIVNVSVESTVDTLINMKESNGAQLEKIYNAIVDSRCKDVRILSKTEWASRQLPLHTLKH